MGVWYHQIGHWQLPIGYQINSNHVSIGSGLVAINGKFKLKVTIRPMLLLIINRKYRICLFRWDKNNWSWM